MYRCFLGTALYVFCALAESLTSPDGDSDMSFYIDGELKGTFIKIAPGNVNVYDYNVPVFTIESLTPEEHNFTLQIGHVNGIQSMVLFDKMVYTCVISPAIFSSMCTKAVSYITGLSIPPRLLPLFHYLLLQFLQHRPWHQAALGNQRQQPK